MRSPGSAPETKTPEPLRRATPLPPYASDSTSRVSSSPREGRVSVAVDSGMLGLSLQAVAWDLDDYRRDAEALLEELDREYYLHLSGHKPYLALEPIYDRHHGLFERDAVDRIGERRRAASGEEATRLRYLHHFALDGHLG